MVGRWNDNVEELAEKFTIEEEEQYVEPSLAEEILKPISLYHVEVKKESNAKNFCKFLKVFEKLTSTHLLLRT